MQINLVAAMAGSRRVIGADGGMPWRLPADMKRFVRLTTGKAILMGRKTYESIGKPLPNRTNIVLTRCKTFAATGCQVCYSLEDALGVCSEAQELMVVGGAEIYSICLPRATRQYLTFIEAELEGDTFYPEFVESEWREVEAENFSPDERHRYPYRFITLIRR